MSDETMKNEKNSEVSDAAVSGPLWTHTYIPSGYPSKNDQISHFWTMTIFEISARIIFLTMWYLIPFPAFFQDLLVLHSDVLFYYVRIP